MGSNVGCDGYRKKKSIVSNRLSIGLAEGVRFELTRERKPPGGFQDRCLKPLGHPSERPIYLRFRLVATRGQGPFATQMLPKSPNSRYNLRDLGPATRPNKRFNLNLPADCWSHVFYSGHSHMGQSARTSNIDFCHEHKLRKLRNRVRMLLDQPHLECGACNRLGSCLCRTIQ